MNATESKKQFYLIAEEKKIIHLPFAKNIARIIPASDFIKQKFKITTVLNPLNSIFPTLTNQTKCFCCTVITLFHR